MGCLGSFQKWFIGNYIREILLDDGDVVGFVGQDIFPLVAPENTEGDFIIYSRVHYQREKVKMGIYEDDAQVELTIVSDIYDNALQIAAAVDNALTGEHEIYGQKFLIDLVDSSEEYYDNKYCEKIIYSIK